MAKRLPAETWLAIRAAYELGTLTVRAIARQFGVDHKTITEKAERERWTRADPSLRRAIDEATDARMAERATPPSRPSQPPQSTPPEPPPPQSRRPIAEIVGLSPQVMTVREGALAQFSTLIAGVNLAQLERLEPLKLVQAQVAELLVLVTASRPPAGMPVEIFVDQQRAGLKILTSDNGGISPAINALARLSESIQTQERRALGLEDRAKRVEVSGPGGGPIPAEAVPPAGAAADSLRLAELPTDALEQVMKAVAILEGAEARPDVPLPPGYEPLRPAP